MGNLEIGQKMFLLLRMLLLVLIIGCWLGCGTDDDSRGETPTVTLELIEQKGEEVWFRLNVTPIPITDLAVLITIKRTESPNEHKYNWQRIPRFQNSAEFGFHLDPFVSWQVEILPLEGVNLNTYSTEDSNIPSDFSFREYVVGDPSVQMTQVQKFATVLSVEALRPMPANGWLILHFDVVPKNITVNHGRARTYDNVVYVHGNTYNSPPQGTPEIEILFPIGEFELEISWAYGIRSKRVNLIVTEPDFKHPEIVRIFALINETRIEFEVGHTRLSPDVEGIEMQFNELVREDIYVSIEIKNEAGDELGWEVAPQESSFGAESIILQQSNGKRLLPETTYTVKGAVIDIGGNITLSKITFTTSAD